jgi:hypothetical protein
MAVFDPLWRGLWWPWLLIWAITLVSLFIAGAIAVTYWLRYLRPHIARHHGISLYLDDDAVMDLYLQYGGKYMEPLSQEVQEHISNSRELELNADLARLQARAKTGVNSDIFSSYIKKAEPITVIGIIIDVLEQADDIVHVDLRKQEVTFNRALDKALDDERPTAVRLRGLDTFVSIRGEFSATEPTAADPTFEAPYGDPPSSPETYLTCTCATSGMRGTAVPTGSFPARCLGRVENWDPQTSRLKVNPIAIFR